MPTVVWVVMAAIAAAFLAWFVGYHAGYYRGETDAWEDVAAEEDFEEFTDDKNP